MRKLLEDTFGDNAWSLAELLPRAARAAHVGGASRDRRRSAAEGHRDVGSYRRARSSLGAYDARAAAGDREECADRSTCPVRPRGR